MIVSLIECALSYKNRKRELSTILFTIAAMLAGMIIMGLIFQEFEQNLYEYRSYCLYFCIVPLAFLFLIDDKSLLNKK
jgi:hypothetical protein